MPRFVFKLAPLLRVRRREEQERQREVAAIERQRRELEDTLRRQQQRLVGAKESLRGRLTGMLDAHDLRLYANSALQQMRQAQRIAVELAGIHRRLEQARTTLAEAARHRRALENLRDRRHAEWRRREARAEAAQLDELCTMRRREP